MIISSGGIHIPSSRGGGAAWTPAQISGLRVWVRGDDPDIDINTTPDPDTVVSLPNRGSLGGLVEQSTEADQPELSTLNGLQCPQSVSADFLGSSLASSNFSFIHETGFGLVCVSRFDDVTAAGAVVTTTTGGGVRRGVRLQLAAGALFLQVFNTSGIIININASVAVDTTYVIRAKYDPSASPEGSLQIDELTPVTAVETSAPDTGDPQFTLGLQANAQFGSSPQEGFLAELIISDEPDAIDVPELFPYLDEKWR